LRSRSRNRSNNTNVPNKGKAVLYADAVSGGSTLNDSIHAPNGSNITNTGSTSTTNNNQNRQACSIRPGTITHMNNIMSQAIKRLDLLVTRMNQWEMTFNALDNRLSNIEKHLNIVPTVTTTTNQAVPIQDAINQQPTLPLHQHNNAPTAKLPVTTNTTNSQAAASSSSSATNITNTNTNNTMQGLSSEFNTMKGDVDSLRAMMASLGDALQSLGAQQNCTAQ
jgi:hypothetical protein